MNAPERRNHASAPPAEEPPADEEYARAYAAGYEEGVRGALRETLEHISHGHMPQEIRMLTASRLARLSEEVELKRKSLLAPPRRPAWGSLLRPPAPARPWAGPAPATSAPAAYRLLPGRSVLVREERPARAVEILRANATTFPRVAVVSMRPPEVPGLPADHRLDLTVGGPGAPDAPNSGALTPGEISGRLREPTEAPRGALVYVDALEFLATEHSLETMIRFVHWLVTQVQETGSALLVSFDPRALDIRDVSRLERAFETVL